MGMTNFDHHWKCGHGYLKESIIPALITALLMDNSMETAPTNPGSSDGESQCQPGMIIYKMWAHEHMLNGIYSHVHPQILLQSVMWSDQVNLVEFERHKLFL